MITRKEAEVQAEHCFAYHATIATGIIGIVALFDRRAIPPVAAGLGIGVAVHAACLFVFPKTRESILRTTASMMEDRRNALNAHESQSAHSEMTAEA